MELTKKKVLKTALLPEVYPRVKELFGSGFGMIAYLIALVYNIVRILPNNHPYLKSDMIGKFTVLQAIREASNHVHVGKKNIDQVIVFFTILTGLLLFVFQFIVMIATMAISRANAQATIPNSVEGFFQTPNQAEDLSFRMLDLVFGVPGIFDSKEEVSNAFHQALQAMFQFYSLGMVAVGAIIILYFVTTLVGETARTGIPFGQRSNKTWMAPRVILFFGLLIPMAHGINGGQYIALYTAKLGSLLATSGWTVFHEKIEEVGETVTGRDEQNVPIPNAPDLGHVPPFMLVAKTCQKAYEAAYNEDYKKLSSTWEQDSIKAWTVYRTPPAGESDPDAKPCEGSIVGDHTVEELGDQSYPDLATCAKGNVYIVFGVNDAEEFGQYRGGILPTCGSLVMQTTDLSQGGSAEIQDAYLELIKELWDGNQDIPAGVHGRSLNEYARNFVKRTMNIDPDPNAELPGASYIKAWSRYLEEYMGDEENGVIAAARERQIEENKIEISQTIKDYGWIGAPLVYNMVAGNAGAFVSSIESTPRADRYAQIMEENKDAKLRKNLNPVRADIFSTTQSAEGVMRDYDLPNENQISRAINTAYQYWDGNAFSPEQRRSDNVVIDTINLIFGTYGLFEICKNTDIHPLAQLSAVGKSMIDSSIAALFATGLTSVVAIIPTEFSPALNSAASFFGTIAGIGLLVGFILFYILPFMPFMYFFFAAGSWLKTIFEAMVAMPLWALAHLRIDGEGIPGEAAYHGYYLLFEIFIRPILIIFGLLAAISVFAALVKVLNEIFYLVISNLSGHDPKSNTVCFQDPALSASDSETKEAELSDAYRGPIDEFFFTVLYTIIVYMLAMSCFKLIDMIPKQILRWIGGEVPSFLDEQGDPAEGLMQYVTLGGSQFGEKISSSIGGLARGTQESVGQFMKQNSN